MKAKINGRKMTLIATVVIIALIVISAFIYLFANQSGSSTLENITIKSKPTIFSILLDVAQNQSLYDKDGLNVTLNDGVRTIEDLPKFSDYVYTDGLKTVKPQSVTIIK